MNAPICHVAFVGCLSNRSDANRLMAFLIRQGYVLGSAEDADLIIVMTCGFSHLKQRQSVGRISDLVRRSKPQARVWVGGCLPSISPSLLDPFPVERCFSPRTLPVPDDFSEAYLSDAVDRDLETHCDSQQHPPYLLRVATGCLDRCSYCAIRNATGSLRSRQTSSLLEEVSQSVGAGALEFYVLGEDIGAYGADCGTTLLSLLTALTRQFPWIRLHLGSIHPRWLATHLDDIRQAFSLPTVVPKASLPVQSGSDRILRIMRRGYRVDQYLRSVEMLQRQLPHIKIATDFLVGFPSETDTDFRETVDLLKRIRFSYVDCFRYDAHPGTPAYRMPGQLPEPVINERHRALSLEVIRHHLRAQGVDSTEALEAFLCNECSMIPLNVNSDFCQAT